MAFRDRLREILKIKETPHRIALSFSTGVFIGMSPFLGIHTILGVIVAWLFKLNTFAIIAGVYVTNPWTIVPIYTFSTWVGVQCFGVKQIIPKIDWSTITFSKFINDLSPLLMPFIFGTLLIGLLSGIVSYLIIYRTIKRIR
ncbi:MAG: DUF2062 domain-containing protein [Nitrospirota bacterium]|nr:DUF2062 domain-containing protein [Nitrospirota bacterium]MDH5768785.1 DUF2062 domain-containing protein [Nitrospirota bacterium]